MAFLLNAARMKVLFQFIVIIAIIGSILAQKCPDGTTINAFTADSVFDPLLTTPVCIRCSYIVNANLIVSTDVTWTRTRSGDTTQVPLTNGTGGVLIDPISTVLILTDPAAVIDVGDTLRCSSQQASGRLHVISIIEFVFISPLILPRNDTINVTEGSSLILQCSNPGNSGITRYQWFNSTGDELSDPVIVPPSLLPFNNIQRASSGVYICRSTKIGINKVSNVTINVQYPPTLSISSSFDGSVFIVNCTFDANPPPSVTWLHNGFVVNISDNDTSIVTNPTYSELTLSSVNLNENGGSYVCFVDNGIGNLSSMPVSYQNVPNPVMKLMASVENTTSDSVVLVWELGFNGNSVITGVIITYVATSNESDNGTVTYPGSLVTEAVISNLQPSTEYVFVVVVSNGIGTSTQKNVTVRTLKVPISTEINVIVIGPNGTVIAGNEVVLICQTSMTFYNDSVVWMREEGSIPMTAIINSTSNELIIPSAAIEDSGNYTCISGNKSFTFLVVIVADDGNDTSTDPTSIRGLTIDEIIGIVVGTVFGLAILMILVITISAIIKKQFSLSFDLSSKNAKSSPSQPAVSQISKTDIVTDTAV